MSQVSDVAEKENQEPMADQVITVGPELNLCLSVECCSHLTNILNSDFSCNLYSWNSSTVENGL